MKKIALILVLTSCTTTKNINQSIKNLETLQEWVKQDYEWQEIPHKNANSYFLVLETVIYDLEQIKNKENDK